MMFVWGTVVRLLIVLTGLLYASLQLPLDNRENKNLRNVCLSQICKKYLPAKISTYTVYKTFKLLIFLYNSFHFHQQC